jgi:hypothetical protein
LVVLFASACGVLFGGNNTEACSNEYIALARITPPEGAENVSERCSTGFNPTQTITFTIEPDQLNAVQSSTSITNWQENAPEPQGFEDEAATLTSYLYGNFGNGAIYQVTLIDTSSPDRYSIYYSGAFVD